MGLGAGSISNKKKTTTEEDLKCNSNKKKRRQPYEKEDHLRSVKQGRINRRKITLMKEDEMEEVKKTTRGIKHFFGVTLRNTTKTPPETPPKLLPEHKMDSTKDGCTEPGQPNLRLV